MGLELRLTFWRGEIDVVRVRMNENEGENGEEREKKIEEIEEREPKREGATCVCVCVKEQLVHIAVIYTQEWPPWLPLELLFEWLLTLLLLLPPLPVPLPPPPLLLLFTLTLGTPAASPTTVAATELGVGDKEEFGAA